MPQLPFFSVAYSSEQERPTIYIFSLNKKISNSQQKELKNFIYLNFIKNNNIDISIKLSGNILLDLPYESSYSPVFTYKGRISCGSSCAPGTRNYSGTIGAIVKKKNSLEDRYIISNNHVLSNWNQIPKGMPILSPSNMDTKPGCAAGEIAILDDIMILQGGHIDYIKPLTEDVALAKITGTKPISSWQGNENNGYNTPISILEPKTNMRVKKIGRTTGLTYGTVIGKHVETCICGNLINEGYAWFTEFWSIQGEDGIPFSYGGDSGSLVVTADGEHAVGLLFAGDGQLSFMFPFVHIASLFGGLELVNDYGV